MSTNTHPFGYKDYNDALHNGVKFTLAEIKQVKVSDKIIILTMTDSDDDYSLENRLFEFEIESISPNGFDAGGFWVDFTDYSSEYFLVLHPKGYVIPTTEVTSDYIPTDEEIEAVRPIIIGDYKTKEKFIEFIGGSNNINFLATEATIEGSQLSGLDYDGITFKLTICDEGTVKFDEVDTNHTSPEQRGRLLEVISDKTLVPYRKRMCVRELKFTSINTVKNEHISLFLVVEYERPIDKLASLFDDDDIIETETEISDEQSNKLDALMSLFDDEEITSEEEEEVETYEVIESYDHRKQMESSFAKMKEDKISEIKERISTKEQDVLRFKNEVKQAEKKVDDAKGEVVLSESRLESLQPEEPFCGYFFNVSERLNEKVSLEPEIAELIKSKISKVKSINADAFMKLFEDGEYQIRLGKMDNDTLVEYTDYENISKEVEAKLVKLKISLNVEDKDNPKLIYTGDMTWGDIINKMVKLGFGQESEFDKMCDSNSYKVGQFAPDDEPDNKEVIL